MLSKICKIVSDDCLLHETAGNTKCIGKLVLIIVILFIVRNKEISSKEGYKNFQILFPN